MSEQTEPKLINNTYYHGRRTTTEDEAERFKYVILFMIRFKFHIFIISLIISHVLFL